MSPLLSDYWHTRPKEVGHQLMSMTRTLTNMLLNSDARYIRFVVVCHIERLRMDPLTLRINEAFQAAHPPSWNFIATQTNAALRQDPVTHFQFGFCFMVCRKSSGRPPCYFSLGELEVLPGQISSNVVPPKKYFLKFANLEGVQEAFQKFPALHRAFPTMDALFKVSISPDDAISRLFRKIQNRIFYPLSNSPRFTAEKVVATLQITSKDDLVPSKLSIMNSKGEFYSPLLSLLIRSIDKSFTAIQFDCCVVGAYKGQPRKWSVYHLQMDPHGSEEKSRSFKKLGKAQGFPLLELGSQERAFLEG